MGWRISRRQAEATIAPTMGSGSNTSSSSSSSSSFCSTSTSSIKSGVVDRVDSSRPSSASPLSRASALASRFCMKLGRMMRLFGAAPAAASFGAAGAAAAAGTATSGLPGAPEPEGGGRNIFATLTGPRGAGVGAASAASSTSSSSSRSFRFARRACEPRRCPLRPPASSAAPAGASSPTALEGAPPDAAARRLTNALAATPHVAAPRAAVAASSTTAAGPRLPRRDALGAPRIWAVGRCAMAAAWH
mmetsp:Transcript_161351/g.518047  ORF Transcript_161351/g.518047 Transcript_161351/m.518047 type:complete len:247 (+) Transcript_161351:3135-3875(+)